jgi:hypothetical protein
MRPTIDEQLAGAARLLRLAEADREINDGAAALVRNARRLVDRVAASWSSALPFLEADNTRMAALLDAPMPGPDRDLAAAAARNEELRAALTQRIRTLPFGVERDAIGAYLRERVAADPT